MNREQISKPARGSHDAANAESGMCDLRIRLRFIRVTNTRRVSGFRLESGFSLVELIVVIMIVGILSGIVAVFIRNPLEGYMAAARRAELTDTADGALARISRDLRAALPNSLRVVSASGTVGSCSGTETCYLEYLPVEAGGRYREALSTSTASGENILDFTAADTAFDVLGQAVNITGAQYLVIYNQGIPGANVWDGDNRSPLDAASSTCTGSDCTVLAFSSFQFPLESPNRRFYLVSTPVSYVCDPVAGTLRRYSGYGAPASTQPTSFGSGTNALLANRVHACSFTYEPGASQRLGQLTLWLQLENRDSDNTEQVSLYREVVVNNDA
jgi:MSHA biogenesis protein MshO